MVHKNEYILAMNSIITVILGMAALLDLTSAYASTSCENAPSNVKSKVGQISPKDARIILKTNDLNIKPELLQITSNAELLFTALRLGLDIQKIGNEAMVYNVDALVYIARGSKPSATEFQSALFSSYQNFMDPTSGDYYDRFQSVTGLRAVATLAILGRKDEAVKLLNYINSGKDKGDIQVLRQLMSNTGNFNSHKNSVKFCELVKKL